MWLTRNKLPQNSLIAALRISFWPIRGSKTRELRTLWTKFPTMALILQRNGRWWSKFEVRNSPKLSRICDVAPVCTRLRETASRTGSISNGFSQARGGLPQVVSAITITRHLPLGAILVDAGAGAGAGWCFPAPGSAALLFPIGEANSSPVTTRSGARNGRGQAPQGSKTQIKFTGRFD